MSTANQHVIDDLYGAQVHIEAAIAKLTKDEPRLSAEAVRKELANLGTKDLIEVALTWRRRSIGIEQGTDKPDEKQLEELAVFLELNELQTERLKAWALGR